MADVFAPQPVKTKTAGDVVVNINAGQTVGLSSGAAVVGKFGIDQTTPGTTNAVSVTNPSIPVTGAFYQTTQPVSIATAPTTPVTGTFFQTTQPVSLATNTPTLQAGAAIVGKVGIDQTTPGTTNLVALAANQSTNTAQLGGMAISVGSGASSTGTQRVILASDQATLAVSQGLSFTTVDSGHLTSAALAAGASITLDGAQIASGIGKLFEASVSSSVAIKAQLGTWDGTTFTVKRTFFVPANNTLPYEPSRYDAITMATGATAKFRWLITNNDNTNAADVYAHITHAI